MAVRIGIRREDKNKWERRVPLVPSDVQRLITQHGLEIWVQPSEIRIFSDQEYQAAGAQIEEDLGPCPTIFAVKEIPPHLLQPGKTYVFFSHTIKGQSYNMPLLKRLLELGCQLIDYERVVDAQGRRLILFGRHAGLAGMIDTLWALGQRWQAEGYQTPLASIAPAHTYANLAAAQQAVQAVGEQLRSPGLPNDLGPLVCGFLGYGNVSQGAQEIWDLLPSVELRPDQLRSTKLSPQGIYKVVFKEADLVEPVASTATFALQDYYQHPERYRPCFTPYLPYLTILMNCIYWEPRYPRFVPKQALKALYQQGAPRLRIIGDISCDLGGTVECTVKATTPDAPVYVYDPLNDRWQPGYQGPGVVIMAVDNLPCELAQDASCHFSNMLQSFVPAIARCDYTVPFEQCALDAPIKGAMIVYQGKLTPTYQYLQEFLQ